MHLSFETSFWGEGKIELFKKRLLRGSLILEREIWNDNHQGTSEQKLSSNRLHAENTHANPIPVFTQCLDCSHQCEGLKGALRNARTSKSLYHGSLCFTLEKKNSHIAIVLTFGRENPTASEVVTVQTSSSITESGLQLILINFFHSLTWITWWCLPKPPFTGENRLSAWIHAQI